MRWIIAAAVFFGGVLPSAVAADEQPSLDLDFNFTAFAWLTRVNGTTTLGSASAEDEVNLEDGLDLDEYSPALGVELEIVKANRWRIQLGGFDFSSDSDGIFEGNQQFGGLALNEGDVFDTAFDLTSIGGEFGLWLWEPYCLGTLPDGRECRIGVRAGPLVGVRHIDLDHRITVPGEASESGGGEWLAPYAGLQLEVLYHLPDSVPLFRWMEIDARAGFGPALGGDGGFLTMLQAGMTLYFNDHVGVGIGYRLIHLSVENDDYEFDGGLQGLFFNATLRF